MVLRRQQWTLPQGRQGEKEKHQFMKIMFLTCVLKTGSDTKCTF
jgi:hypothetical protein